MKANKECSDDDLIWTEIRSEPLHGDWQVLGDELMRFLLTDRSDYGHDVPTALARSREWIGRSSERGAFCHEGDRRKKVQCRVCIEK